MSKLHCRIQVTGKVQGVFFRTSAKEEADRLGITGFVRNQPDGSVYIEAEGLREALDAFIEWCRQGPRLAEVQNIEIEEGEIQHFKDFQISAQ